MTTFSCAVQDVPLEDGSALRFGASLDNHAECTLTLGAHTLVFQRNGPLLRIEAAPEEKTKENDDGKDKRRQRSGSVHPSEGDDEQRSLGGRAKA